MKKKSKIVERIQKQTYKDKHKMELIGKKFIKRDAVKALRAFMINQTVQLFIQ
jgi:hypothetical protein